ncbi:hypothetical protein ACFLQI_01450 [Candidatus Undinarchaeota archaeon]
MYMWKRFKLRMLASRGLSGALVTMMLLAVGIGIASIAVGFAQGAAAQLNETAGSKLSEAMTALE